MKKPLNVSIPNPCQEDWSKMTPNEHGRFCDSCSKTVVDFTKKSVLEIQEILLENRHKRLCGYFYKKQLDSITIEIPNHVLHQQMSFSKLFLLVLLITMGTTLLSCDSGNGKKQKINSVVLIDSLQSIEEEIDSSNLAPKENLDQKKEKYSQKEQLNKANVNSEIIEEEIETLTLGVMIMGDITEEISEQNLIKINDISEVVEEEDEEEMVFGMINEVPPKFKGTEEGSIDDLKTSFSDSITNFIKSNFNLESTINLDLAAGKHKIWAQFTINEEGNIINLRARAPHKILEQEIVKILAKLPQVVPGQQRGKPVKVAYTLPISFEIE